MNPEEVRRHRAIKTLRMNLLPMVVRWKTWARFTKIEITVRKCYVSYMVRKQLNFVLNKPISLGENPCFVFLKEQKYLVKHIM